MTTVKLMTKVLNLNHKIFYFLFISIESSLILKKLLEKSFEEKESKQEEFTEDTSKENKYRGKQLYIYIYILSKTNYLF